MLLSLGCLNSRTASRQREEKQRVRTAPEPSTQGPPQCKATPYCSASDLALICTLELPDRRCDVERKATVSFTSTHKANTLTLLLTESAIYPFGCAASYQTHSQKLLRQRLPKRTVCCCLAPFGVGYEELPIFPKMPPACKVNPTHTSN